MVFKELKKIMEDENQENKPTLTKTDIRPEKQIQFAKTSSDGVGYESSDQATKTSNFLQGVLPTSYSEIKKVTSDKSMVKIIGAAAIKDFEAFEEVLEQMIKASYSEQIDIFEHTSFIRMNKDVTFMLVMKKTKDGHGND